MERIRLSNFPEDAKDLSFAFSISPLPLSRAPNKVFLAYYY
jgi:hypothetical protein